MPLLSYVVLGCLLSGGEGATAYKCGDARGHSYQSLPCEGVELKRWTVAPEPMDVQTVKHLEDIRRKLQQDAQPRAQGRRRHRGRDGAVPKVSACQKARQGRDRAYAKAGLRRDFALSSLWDNKVQQACK